MKPDEINIETKMGLNRRKRWDGDDKPWERQKFKKRQKKIKKAAIPKSLKRLLEGD